MKAFLCLAVILAIASSTNLESTLTERDLEHYRKVLHSRWGRVAVELAELNALAGGPVENLKSALVDLRNDAQNDLKRTENDYAKKQNFHEKKVQTLSQNIQNAQGDIIRLTSLLNNALYPAKKNYENTIKNLKQNIAHNLRVQAQETERSNQARAVYTKIANEHKAAIADLDMCIRVVTGLINPSLAQVSQIHILLRKVQASLNSHEKYAPMINSILQLSSQKNLGDANAIRGCIKLLNSLRQSIVDDLNALTAIENARIAAYNKRMGQLREELAMFRKQLADNIKGLTETIQRIKVSIQQRHQRTIDLRNFKRELKDENSWWVAETQNHNAAVKDLSEQINGAEEVIGFLNNANFGSYLKSQLDRAGAKFVAKRK